MRFKVVSYLLKNDINIFMKKLFLIPFLISIVICHAAFADDNEELKTSLELFEKYIIAFSQLNTQVIKIKDEKLTLEELDMRLQNLAHTYKELSVSIEKKTISDNLDSFIKTQRPIPPQPAAPVLEDPTEDNGGRPAAPKGLEIKQN